MRKHVAQLPATETGAAVIAELHRKGIKDVVCLNSNEGPFPPFPEALAAIQEAAARSNRYPDPTGRALVEAIAGLHGIAAEHVILGPGSTSLLFLLGAALLDADDELVYPWPSFPQYRNVALHQCARPVAVALKDYDVDLDRGLAAITPRTRLVVVPNPNNPTGVLLDAERLDRFVRDLPGGVVAVMDEAYAEYVPSFRSGLEYVREGRPVVVLRSFSKVYGLAGLRIGYAMGPADLVAGLRRLQPPFALSQLAMAAATASLARQDRVGERAKANEIGREQLCAGFRGLGLAYAPSSANFVLVDLGRDARETYAGLIGEGVLVRSGLGYDCPRHLRVTVGLPHENARFLEALERVLAAQPRT